MNAKAIAAVAFLAAMCFCLATGHIGFAVACFICAALI